MSVETELVEEVDHKHVTACESWSKPEDIDQTNPIEVAYFDYDADQ